MNFKVSNVSPWYNQEKTIIESLYFLNHDDLNLLLNRIPQIRAANPLCSGSLSIKALSLSLQNENKTHH